VLYCGNCGLQLLDKKKQLELVVDQHTLGHFGVEIMYQGIKEQGFWWPTMRQDIKTEIDHCISCLKFNVQKEGFHPAKSILADQPWDHVEIDLIGPLTTSARGMTFILSIVDVCTSFTIVRSLPNKEMETVSRELWKVFCDFGTPKIVQSDNGTEFSNHVMTALTNLYGIDHRLITAYHPQANGLVERRNKEISRSLKKFVEGAYGAWDDWLPMVQLSLNQAVGKRTNSAAFSLFLGRKFNGFEDYSKVEEIQDLQQVLEKKKTFWVEFQEAVLPAISAHSLEMEEKQEERLNKRKQFKPLQTGDTVMATDQTRSSKWEPVYEGLIL
jgi:transposase InsO family protein